MIEIPPAQINAYRNKILQGTDAHLVTDVGYFIVWYSAAELALTTILAVASKSPDLEIFDSLCSGMDARVKIERLRRIRKPFGGIGPNLDLRLRHFDDKARKIRNIVAHSFIGRSESGEERYFASALSSLPWKELNEKSPHPNPKQPRIITPGELLGWGGWLALLCDDLSACFNAAALTGVFEIENPKTMVPQANQETQPQPIPRAKRDRRDQKPRDQ